MSPVARSLVFAVMLLFLLPPAGIVDAAPVLELSPVERSWLSEHKSVRLGIDIDWKPFEFVDENRVYQGMAADYMALVEERLGIEFEVSLDRPWPEVVKAVREHELDAFSCVVKTPQREKFVTFTDPYISSPMVIITLDSEPFIDGIPALAKKETAVVNNYASHDLLKRHHPNLPLKLAKNVRQGLEWVSNGQADAFIGNLAVASLVMREVGLANLKVSGQTPYRFELAMAVRNDWPELVAILQTALDSITQEERDGIYNKWIRVQYDEQVDYRVIATVVGVGFLILMIILVWNQKLQNEIKRRKKIQEHLWEESARHKAILDNAVEGIITIDNRGIIEAANSAAENLFGYSQNELLGKNISILTPSPHRENHDLYLQRYLESGKAKIIGTSREVEGVHKNGDLIPLDLSVNDVRIGDRTLFTGILHDLTERKQADRLKNEFVSTVSHELRTPLTSIQGSLGLIKGGACGEIPQQAASLVDVAYRNSERLVRLINDILDMEKIEAGKLDFKMQALEISPLIHQAVESNAAYAEKHGVFLVIKDDLVGVQAVVDSDRFAQVMANLLSNAAKFSPSGAAVEISLTRRAGRLQVSVTDHGPGIAEEFKPRVFQKFSQADSGNTRKTGGTGLGLSICKVIVERMGGDIDFETAAGSGSRFYFTLPEINPRS